MSNQYIDKISLKINIAQLNKIISSLLSNNTIVTQKFIWNANKLFSKFVSNLNDYEKELRVFVIVEISKFRLRNPEIRDIDNILTYMTFDGKYQNDVYNAINQILADPPLIESEFYEIESFVSDNLIYAFIGNKIDVVNKFIIDYKGDNYDNLNEFVSQLEDVVDDLQLKIKRSKAGGRDAKNDITSDKFSLMNAVSDLIEKKKNPRNKIKTGIKTLNTMLNGGFEAGRVYLAASVAKGGKSLFLLTIGALGAIKYNKHIKAKNPNMKPVVLYLTQENSISETIERVWSYMEGSECDLSVLNPEEVSTEIDKEFFKSEDPQALGLEIKYRSDHSINTMDLNGIIDELAIQGKEVVFLVQDYCKRIKSTRPEKELRMELGAIADEFCVIAKERDIPILTATQLNRDAFKIFQEMGETAIQKQMDINKRLGSHNIGESIDLIQNVDYAFIVARSEQTKQLSEDVFKKEFYLHVKLLANRGKDVPIDNFIHPFETENNFRIVEDIYDAKSSSITDFKSFAEHTYQNQEVQRQVPGPKSNERRFL